MERHKSAVISGSGFDYLIKNPEEENIVTLYGVSPVGLLKKISTEEVSEASKKIVPRLEQALTHALAVLPLTRDCCSCKHVLENLRFA